MQMLWKTGWQSLETLNTELPYDPAIPLLGIHPRELKTYVPKKTYTGMFTTVLFVTLKKWKPSKCPYTDKMWYIHSMD